MCNFYLFLKIRHNLLQKSSWSFPKNRDKLSLVFFQSASSFWNTLVTQWVICLRLPNFSIPFLPRSLWRCLIFRIFKCFTQISRWSNLFFLTEFLVFDWYSSTNDINTAIKLSLHSKPFNMNITLKWRGFVLVFLFSTLHITAVHLFTFRLFNLIWMQRRWNSKSCQHFSTSRTNGILDIENVAIH